VPKNQPPIPGDPAPPTGEIVLYQTEDGQTRVECRFVDETLWLSQALIAELFQVTVATVNEHIKNILDEGEVPPGPTIRSFRIVRREGPREVDREIEHYNLDAILAVGYRVRSERGTQFRRWATERLSEYLVKGLTLDDLRLKAADARWPSARILFVIICLRDTNNSFENWPSIVHSGTLAPGQTGAERVFDDSDKARLAPAASSRATWSSQSARGLIQPS